MQYQIFSENEWIYPDSTISNANNRATLYAARGSDVNMQVLTDHTLSGGETISVSVSGLACELTVHQLLPAFVSENSGPDYSTTKNYEEVRHFVTRKAPFSLYDITKPLHDGILEAGRAAFYMRLNIALDAVPGTYEGRITLSFCEETLVLPVSLKIYSTQVPPLERSSFHMVNWIYYPLLAKQFGVEPYSEEYRTILGRFLENQLDMRNDHLMIPAGEPIRNDSGEVVDFDFSHAEFVGNLALSYGFKYIMGGFVARWIKWDGPDNALLWDREVVCTTVEGFRQLKLYFIRAWECVCRNHWNDQYMQCLVDEPQFQNSLSYRAISGICRQNMPGVIINDPVETTEIGGACDIWVVKQAIYEKYLDTFTNLQKQGETMWLYTCGFPAGATMNRVMDLPLTVSRLPMWLCYLYNCPGFLHWGYHCYLPPQEGLVDGCCSTGTARYPAGNGFVVYVGNGEPWYSVRGHLQRTGAQDYELFHILGQRDKAKALALIRKVCRSFDDYNGSAALFDEVRHELLEALG